MDITASHEERTTIVDVVKKTAEQVFMPLTVGGGIHSLQHIENLLQVGADKVSINSAAVKKPDFVREAAQRFGRQCIVVAIDAKSKEDKTGWEIYTHGGRKNTGIDALEWAKRMEEYGAGEILLTSMDRDGTKEGYNIPLTSRISDTINIPVIASGGAGTLEHLKEGLTQGKADAVLAASIFHYGQYSIREAKEYLQKEGILIRM